jgi:hypothetical protein
MVFQTRILPGVGWIGSPLLGHASFWVLLWCLGLPASSRVLLNPRPKPNMLLLLVVALSVGEFRKTRHPRNVKFNKVLEVCFSGAGNSRISEAWNLRSLEFANVLSSGILIRQRSGVTSVRKPGISTGDGPNFGEMPIRESDEDPVRGSGVWASTNQRGRKDQFGDLLKI